jgi:uncharacterized Fe-S center protein
MKSKVYFVAVYDGESLQHTKLKILRLLNESHIFGFIEKDNSVAIKMHFGEEGNTGFVNPAFVRLVAEDILQRQARPFLIDTNALYKGRRTNSQEHLRLAAEHGFRPDLVWAPVLIADDKASMQVAIDGKFIKAAKIPRVFLETEVIVGLAHFKGHIMTGFGGALKNIGMGCASREGKLEQHGDVAPFVVSEKCDGCLLCQQACPAKAILQVKGKSVIKNALCIGCASCIAICPRSAIDVQWHLGASTIQEKMAEYAKAVLQDRFGRAAFINFATHITKECDCLAKDDPSIAPDIGIFASHDPVSIDKACFDSVNKACATDIFKEVHPERDGLKQLRYAVKLGLGKLDYELIDLTQP